MKQSSFWKWAIVVVIVALLPIVPTISSAAREKYLAPSNSNQPYTLAPSDAPIPGESWSALDTATSKTIGQVPATKNLDLDLSLNLPKRENKVEVFREPSGVVHIEAKNENDLFFSLGFVHASDRLWQMDFQRRTVAGRLSEVLGETTLEQDTLNRSIGLYRAAQSAYNSLPHKVKQVVGQYTQGVNAYLNQNLPLSEEFQQLGYKPEPWQPSDVLALQKLQSLGLSTNFESELFRSQLLARGLSFERIQELFPLYTGNVTILQPEDIEKNPGLTASTRAERQGERGRSVPALPTIYDTLTNSGQATVKSTLALSQLFSPTPLASNNWVVAGDRTTTGKPLLANDPHLRLQIPSTWYLVDLKSPTFKAIGASLPGQPGVAIGRNRHITWGATSLLADVQDLYILAETPDRKGYVYKDRFLPYQVRTETIKVLGRDDVVVSVRESVYGPVISDALEISQPMALQWVSLAQEDNSLGAFLDINRAKNWQEFTQALKSYVAPGLNFVYADVDGNIGYFAPGQIPIRQRDHTGLVPVPGTGQFDWQGFIPFEQLPQVYNPKSGFVVTANNRVAPDSYPYQISLEWAEPYRAERIRELILSQDKLSLQDMQAIQLDQITLLYRDFKPILERIQPILNSLDPLPTATLDWLNQLLEWNGNVSPDSRTATVFEAWYTELTKISAAAIEQEFLAGNQIEPTPRFLLQAFAKGDLAFGGTPKQFLNIAAEALQKVAIHFGNAVPQWGEIHQAVFENPAFPSISRQVPFGGDRYTINVGTYDSQTFLMRNGSSYRQLIDLSNLENSQFIHPIGQSGQLSSPFFDNLLPLWQQDQYLPMKTKDFPIAAQ
ncbi:MAG: Penicillin acylase 2 proenzyme [Chroococcidiopsis sp. SAG 2025]|uniref:penicillin acylase family protein n=1 Tax=Chroococcidiopsis sp. SAG 2025 TaxID=171389 RepID=UPI000D06604A|nr:penicillin acylase family protein [Chroococcidiopsis sp. SAG 2025]MDV2997246.1 Penicillin acylase 2 proenzyme [Chroococcidiopsis sp. SAG 2025]PSB47096.1 penicillin acylase family protein [Cyanosarcina cf. burmensis CCALA 770]